MFIKLIKFLTGFWCGVVAFIMTTLGWPWWILPDLGVVGLAWQLGPGRTVESLIWLLGYSVSQWLIVPNFSPWWPAAYGAALLIWRLSVNAIDGLEDSKLLSLVLIQIVSGGVWTLSELFSNEAGGRLIFYVAQLAINILLIGLLTATRRRSYASPAF